MFIMLCHSYVQIRSWFVEGVLAIAGEPSCVQCGNASGGDKERWVLMPRT